VILSPSADRLPAIPAVLPGLDGVRAISILLVMISHSGLAHVVPGVFGVTLFFFISGFLITTLMLVEFRRDGRLAIGAFYMRRLIRLYPPLIVSIGVTVLVMALYGIHVHPLGILGALAYLANYLAIFRPDLVAGLGGQLWSLAVEEHFYFVYPLVMTVLLARPRLALPALALVCLASLMVRVYVVINHTDIATDYTGKATETRLDSILYGAMAALMWWSARGRAVMDWLIRPSGLMVAGLLIVYTLAYRNPVFRETLRYSLQGLALMPLVVAATVAGTLPRITALLEAEPVRWIGRLSYSLYLWHILGLDLGERLMAAAGLPFVAGVALGWLLSFGFAMASYRFVEKPFFALRKRFGSNVQATAHGAA